MGLDGSWVGEKLLPYFPWGGSSISMQVHIHAHTHSRSRRVGGVRRAGSLLKDIRINCDISVVELLELLGTCATLQPSSIIILSPSFVWTDCTFSCYIYVTRTVINYR